MQSQMQVDRQPASGNKPPVEAHPPQAQRWSLARKFAFLFAVVYFPLFTLYIPVHFVPIPPIPQLFAKFQSLWRILILWVGEGLMHLNLQASPLNTTTGSKDTVYNYVQLLCYVVFAAAVALVWAVLDRKRPNYEWLQKWLFFYLRIVLGITMIQYGAVKIFPTQFPPPSLTTLTEAYGDSSPMHLLWTFMGASWLYTLFAGGAEMLGGILLFIPRTVTLGALVSLGAMTNVLMLNLGYDVPVKIWVFHLVIMSGILLLPDVRRLADFFLFNRRTELQVQPPLFQRRSLNQAALALQLIFGMVILGYNLYHANRQYQQLLAQRNAPLYGVWTVEEFTLDGQTHLPLLTDRERWQRLYIEGNSAVGVQKMNDGRPSQLGLRINPQTKSLRIIKPDDWAWRAEFVYDNPQPDLLTLQGKIDGHPAAVSLRRSDESNFLLTNRGFHWVNAFSLNR